jgi:hypothetical protein
MTKMVNPQDSAMVHVHLATQRMKLLLQLS